MKLFLILITALTFWLNSFSQFDSFYYGSYSDEDYTMTYVVYGLDEGMESCFLVDYLEYMDEEYPLSFPGTGYCDSETGEFLITLDTDAPEEPRKAVFGMDEYNFKTLTVTLNNGTSTTFYEVSEAESSEEFYFMREDGSELELYMKGEKLGFTIFGWTEGYCEYNELSGYLMPMNEELTVFAYEDDNGCRIEFLFTSSYVEISETNCDKLHMAPCTDWNGIYNLMEDE